MLCLTESTVIAPMSLLSERKTFATLSESGIQRVSCDPLSGLEGKQRQHTRVPTHNVTTAMLGWQDYMTPRPESIPCFEPNIKLCGIVFNFSMASVDFLVKQEERITRACLLPLTHTALTT